MALRMSYSKKKFHDDATFETLTGLQPVQFYDDFLGADVVIPANGAVESGCKWSKLLVSEGTVNKVAESINGICTAKNTATDTAQQAILCMNDELQFCLATGLIFEARVAMKTLPTTG